MFVVIKSEKSAHSVADRAILAKNFLKFVLLDEAFIGGV